MGLQEVCVGRVVFELVFLQEHARDMQEPTVREINSGEENTLLSKVVTVMENRDQSARGGTGKWWCHSLARPAELM